MLGSKKIIKVWGGPLSEQIYGFEAIRMSWMDASRLLSTSAARSALPSLTKGLVINSLCFSRVNC